MRELTIAELKEKQMQIMDYVDSFCRKNNIQYTLAFGTLLGAERHGGYIPWDDDIDIQLVRSEYNRFTELWNKNKSEHPFELINIESGNNMGYPFGKIHDPKTVTYVENLERTGVFIDVFPMDYVLNEKDFKVRHEKIRDLYKKRDACFTWMVTEKANLPFWKKIMPYLRKPRMSYEDIAISISELAKQVVNKTDFIYDLVIGVYSKAIIPSSVFGEFKDIKFEDRIYRSVKDTETYLTKTYGDWRTPPPPEKQVTHHGFKAFWRD